MIVAGNEGAVGTCVHDLWITRVGSDRSALPAADVIPILACDHPVVGAAGDGNCAVVLLRSVHPIRPVVVDGDMVELRRRLIVLLGPGLPAVHGYRHPAIVAVDETLRVGGIDPQPMMIAVRGGQQLEGLPAVAGTECAGVQHIHRVGLLGIGEHMGEVPGALAIALIVVDARPGIAGIVGAIESALFGFDERIDATGIRSRNRNANASEIAFRQTVADQLVPRESAVHRFVQAAPGAATVEVPGLAADLPQCGVNNAGISGIEYHINGAGIVVLIQDLLPGFATVGRAENTPLCIRAPRVSQGRDQNDVRIARVNDDGADVARVFQTYVLPGQASVG